MCVNIEDVFESVYQQFKNETGFVTDLDVIGPLQCLNYSGSETSDKWFSEFTNTPKGSILQA